MEHARQAALKVCRNVYSTISISYGVLTKILGIRSSWRAAAGCNPVSLRMNRFESYGAHQNKLDNFLIFI